jgi:hypothetical protein
MGENVGDGRAGRQDHLAAVVPVYDETREAVEGAHLNRNLGRAGIVADAVRCRM